MASNILILKLTAITINNTGTECLENTAKTEFRCCFIIGIETIKLVRAGVIR
jgi:hypothetical protein